MLAKDRLQLFKQSRVNKMNLTTDQQKTILNFVAHAADLRKQSQEKNVIKAEATIQSKMVRMLDGSLMIGRRAEDSSQAPAMTKDEVIGNLKYIVSYDRRSKQ